MEKQSSTPMWTEHFQDDPGGLDLLGVSGSFRRIQDTLIPALTGATWRPRYYSFFCWVIDRFHKSGLPHSKENWARFLYAYESVFILASKYHHHDQGRFPGIVGTTAMHNFAKSKPAKIPIAKPLVNRQSAWIPAQYKPSFAALNMAHYDSSTIPSLVRDVGDSLAATFEESLGTELSTKMKCLDDPKLTHVDLDLIEEISTRACLCGQGMRAAEKTALVESIVFSATVPPDKYFGLRLSQSFELLLTITEANVAPADPATFEELLYRLGGNSGIEIPLPKYLVPTVVAWRTLMLRSYQQYALELVWTSLHRYFIGKQFDQTSLIQLSRLCEARLDKVIESIGLNGKTQLTVGGVSEEIKATLVSSGLEHGLVGFFAKDGLEEIDIFWLADDSLDSGSYVDAINYGATLLLVTSERLKTIGLGNDEMVHTLANFGGTFSLSMATISKTLSDMGDRKWEEFIRFLLESWALSKHLITAATKLSQDPPSYTFRFELNENGYLPVGESLARSVETKLGILISLATNLGLIETAESSAILRQTANDEIGIEGNLALALTQAGRECLESLRKSHDG